MGKRRAWHEDDRFWAEAADIVFAQQMRDRAADEARAAVKLLGARRGAHLLDMPCGIGRHSAELLKRGFRVTGVDRSARYLREARRAGRRFAKRATWVLADMREFTRPGAFDGVLNLFTSFGYFEDPADDERVARNFFESLRPGGRLVMDLLGKELLGRRYQAEIIREPAPGTILIERPRVMKDWTWIRTTWTVIRGGRRRDLVFSHRLYSAAELRGLLERAGFAEVRAYGSLAGTPYDHEATRLVVVARRPMGAGIVPKTPRSRRR